MKPTIRKNSYQIKVAQHEDATAISALIRNNTHEVAANGYSEEQKATWIANNTPGQVRQQLASRTIFCCLLDDRIVGVIGLKERMIVGLYVAPDFLGMGIGGYLLQYLEAYAKQTGISKLELYATPAGNPFYLRHGYEPEGVEEVIIDSTVFIETKMYKVL